MCVSNCWCACVGVQLKGEPDFLVESIKSPSNKQRLPQVVPKATAIPQTNPKTPHPPEREKEQETTISVEKTFTCYKTRSENLKTVEVFFQ